MSTEYEELPSEARAKLPPRAQQMFAEILKRARDAANSDEEAERMAWKAVGRKYEEREGMQLWVRKDWKGSAKKMRRATMLPPGSDQRRLARVERAKHEGDLSQETSREGLRVGRRAPAPSTKRVGGLRGARPRRSPGTRGATTIRTLTGRTLERSFPGECASLGSKARVPTRRRDQTRRMAQVGNAPSGGTTATSKRAKRARRLGEEPAKRKGMPQRRAVGRRA